MQQQGLLPGLAAASQQTVKPYTGYQAKADMSDDSTVTCSSKQQFFSELSLSSLFLINHRFC